MSSTRTRLRVKMRDTAHRILHNESQESQALRCFSQTSPFLSCANYRQSTLSTLGGKPKVVAQCQTTPTCTFQRLQLDPLPASQLLCSADHPQDPSIPFPKSDSHLALSAPPSYFQQASHVMLNLLVHSATLGSFSHSDCFTSVGRSAVDRSLVKLLGMRKKRVVVALLGHFPASSTLWGKVRILTQHSPERSIGPSDGNRLLQLPC